MTIYSQHPSRGKVQILATYRTTDGLTSETVTSVATPSLAAPITDALNRVSALATVPISTPDKRGDRWTTHPSDHLASLADPGTREALLKGAHSLWYEYVRALLHHALADLDAATADAPPPVRTAITAELQTEAAHLYEAFVEESGGIRAPRAPGRRLWDSSSPCILFTDTRADPRDVTQEYLDELERTVPRERLASAVEDLCLLVSAHALARTPEAFLEPHGFQIDIEGPEAYGHYLVISAPAPDGLGPSTWQARIGFWIPDPRSVPGFADDEHEGAVGSDVLTCRLSEPPTPSRLADLLSRVAATPALLDTWATTPVGSPLLGTDFVVTHREDE
ncbi:hypothetical protein GCM10022221_69540 [Actinocorallia aurea]